MISILLAGVLAPFFFEAAPEVRSTYVSLGKIVEDRPMQTTFLRAGYDAGDFGRFSVRNWDVSSLTDRRHDAHRRALYHTEFGPAWQYDLNVADDWRVATELARCWTLYRGFVNRHSDRTYHWWQITQSLENPYLVPYYQFRRCFRGSDYVFCRAGLRRRFPFENGLYATPAVIFEGGNSRNQRRVLGPKGEDRHWNDGLASVSFRLELGWRATDWLSAFVFVEQYEVVGGDERRVNGASTYRCAHNDWTLGGAGVRVKF